MCDWGKLETSSRYHMAGYIQGENESDDRAFVRTVNPEAKIGVLFEYTTTII